MMRSNNLKGGILARLLVVGIATISLPLFAQDSNYTVHDLLQPCRDGDNDSRGGAIDELECEQYINGVIDAVSQTRNLKKAGFACQLLTNVLTLFAGHL